MKAGWQVHPLAKIADCCLGKMLDKQKNRGESQPYLRNVNVRWFKFDLSDLLEMPFETYENERYSIRKGDLIICEGGYPGRCAIWEDDETIFFQKALHRVRCHEPERAKWVQYFLWMSDADGSLRSHFTGSGIQHLTGQALARLKIPLPPLEEQRLIVAVLDEAFAAIATATANAEKNLANARELFGAVFAQSLVEPGVGWSVLEIRNVADLISGQHIDASDYNNAQRGIGYLTGPSDFGERTPVVTKWTEHPKRTALRGDILITVKGSGVGSVNVMEEGELAISRQLMAVRVNHTDPELVYYALEAGFEHFQGLATGAAIPGISRDHVLDFKIAIPPESDLLDFMNRLHSLRATASQLTENYRQQISSLTALKQSLLHRAFTGELTVAMRETIAA